jgi:hypothetical protein
MESQTVKKFRWFWPWQDEVEEDWLREMSQQGLHLASVGVFGIYSFAGGQPQDYVYRLDYINPAKDKPAYLRLFQDAGWEYVGEMSGWQYFRKLAQNGELPVIYSDAESKAEKYRRLLVFQAIIFLMLLVLMPKAETSSLGVFLEIVQVIYLVLIAIYLFLLTNTWRRISQLTKR